MKSANLRELVTQNVPTATSLRNTKKFSCSPQITLDLFIIPSCTVVLQDFKTPVAVPELLHTQ